MSFKFEITDKDKVISWINMLRATRSSLAVAILLSGDRWSCVDKVVLATNADDEIVGISTIASKGEMGIGQPTIVALYVLSEYRGLGVGYRLLEATADHMMSTEYHTIHVDVMNSKILHMINCLSIEKRVLFSIDDQSNDRLDIIIEA